MSQVRTNSIVPAGGIPAGASGGGIIQCVSTTKTDTFSTSSTSFTDITGLSVAITPRSTSNKLLVTGFVSIGPTNDTNTAVIIDVNGTSVGNADVAGSRQRAHTTISYYNLSSPTYTMFPIPLYFLYSPSSTSAQTVKLRIVQGDTSGAITYINRTSNDTDDVWLSRGVSTLTVLEVSG